MKKNSNMKNMAPIATGIATAAVMGTAVYMMTNKKSSNSSKTMKRTAGKALKTVGAVMERMY